MKIYFLSSCLCALRLNGLHFGVTDKFERFVEVSLKDRIFVEFIPQNALPIGFFLTEDIRFTPPAGCEIYLLPDAVAIYARDFQPIDHSLQIIAQERFQENLVTVFRQGPLQISIESQKGFFISTLPPSFYVCELSFHAHLFFLKGENMLAIYTKTGKCVFLEEILDYSIEENILNATLPLSDTLGRQAKCRYALTEDGCYRTEFILQQGDNGDEAAATKINDELLPYAFFESVLIGANYAEFLCDELVLDADKIRSFLGDFEGVTLTKEPNVCGLVRKKAERLYEIVYYTVKLENGKLADIRQGAPTASEESKLTKSDKAKIDQTTESQNLPQEKIT